VSPTALLASALLASTVVITIAAATAPNALAGLRPALIFAQPVVLSLFLIFLLRCL
jgi:hypothetical protein